MVKWAIELVEFGLRFAPWHAIKRQVFTDFVVEWTPVPNIEPMEETAILTLDGDKHWTMEYWCMYFNGSLTLQGAGARVVLISPDGHTLKYAVQLDFRATNNMAAYEGILAGLRAAAGLGVCHLLVQGDSQLVVN